MRRVLCRAPSCAWLADVATNAWKYRSKLQLQWRQCASLASALATDVSQGETQSGSDLVLCSAFLVCPAAVWMILSYRDVLLVPES